LLKTGYYGVEVRKEDDDTGYVNYDNQIDLLQGTLG